MLFRVQGSVFVRYLGFRRVHRNDHVTGGPQPVLEMEKFQG